MAENRTNTAPPPPPTTRNIEFLQTATRGLRGRCPNCGAGALFDGYLNLAHQCAHCETSFAAHSVDDGAAWLTILLLGPTTIVPSTFIVGVSDSIQTGVGIAVVLGVNFAAILAALPRLKGFIWSVTWLSGRASSERQQL